MREYGLRARQAIPLMVWPGARSSWNEDEEERSRLARFAGRSIDLPVTVPAAAAQTLVVDVRRRVLTPTVVSDSIILSGRSCDDATRVTG